MQKRTANIESLSVPCTYMTVRKLIDLVAALLSCLQAKG